MNKTKRDAVLNEVIKAYKDKCIKFETLPNMKKLMKNLGVNVSGKYAEEIRALVSENLTKDTFSKYEQFLDRFCLCRKDIMSIFDITETNVKRLEDSGILSMYCGVTKNYPIKYTVYLYKISDIIRIFDAGEFEKYKRRKKEDNYIEESNRNIAEALYIINKSAKKSRDTKQKSYYTKAFSSCHAAKTRAQNLYYIKDEAIKKLIEEEKINYMGMHRQVDNDDMYFKLYEMEGFTFHIPTNEYVESELLDGVLPEKIDAEPKKKTKLNYTQAVKLLEHYTGKKASGNYSNCREWY